MKIFRSEIMEIKIQTDYIKLDQFLKLTGSASTGGQGKILIQEGEVLVNGQVVYERGKKLRRGDRVSFLGEDFTIV